MDKPFRASQHWQAFFDDKNRKRSLTVVFRTSARSSDDTATVFDFHRIVAHLRAGTVDSFNCHNAQFYIVELHLQALRDFLGEKLKPLPDNLEDIKSRLEKVQQHLKEFDHALHFFDDVDNNKENLEEELVLLQESLQEKQDDLADRVNDRSGDSTIFTARDALSDLRASAEKFEAKMQENSELHTKTKENLRELLQPITALTENLDKNLEDWEAMFPKGSDLRSRRRAIASTYTRARRAALLNGSTITVRDKILASIVDLMIQPDGFSVPFEGNDKETRLGLAFLVDLLRCIPEHTTEIFDQMVLGGEPSFIKKFNQAPIQSDIGELGRSLMHKIVQEPEIFLLEMELEDSNETCDILGQEVPSKLLKFCNEILAEKGNM